METLLGIQNSNKPLPDTLFVLSGWLPIEFGMIRPGKNRSRLSFIMLWLGGSSQKFVLSILEKDEKFILMDVFRLVIGKGKMGFVVTEQRSLPRI